MRIIKINNKEINIATNFNECSVEFLRKYASINVIKSDLYYKIEEGKLEIQSEGLFYQSQVELLYHLIGIEFDTFQKLTKEQLYGILFDFKLLSFTFEENNLTKLPYSNGLKVNGKFIDLPFANFNNLTVEQYFFADSYFKDYLKNREIKNLLRLFVILTSSSNLVDVDLEKEVSKIKIKRVNSFSQPLSALFVKKYDHLTINDLGIFFLWFDACRKLLVKNFPNVFRKPEGEEETESNNASNPLQIFLTLSDNKLSELDRVKKSNIWEGMGVIENSILTSERLQANSQMPD